MATVQRGTDSSGRTIRSTAECWAAWDAACIELGFVPTIVQGGFMGAGGADASAGTHAGDAFDIRLWDRTPTERAQMIRVFRGHAFAYWERYESQGFDLHAHMVPGPWASPAPQALDQWNDYLNGRNGLASNGADYHPRPTPLVTTPPKDDDMFSDEDRALLRSAVTAAQEATKAATAAKARVDKMGGNLKTDRANDANLRKALREVGADVDKVLARLTELDG